MRRMLLKALNADMAQGAMRQCAQCAWGVWGERAHAQSYLEAERLEGKEILNGRKGID